MLQHSHCLLTCALCFENSRVLINLLMFKEGDCSLMRIYGDDEVDDVLREENLVKSFDDCEQFV